MGCRLRVHQLPTDLISRYFPIAQSAKLSRVRSSDARAPIDRVRGLVHTQPAGTSCSAPTLYRFSVNLPNFAKTGKNVPNVPFFTEFARFRVKTPIFCYFSYDFVYFFDFLNVVLNFLNPIAIFIGKID